MNNKYLYYLSIGILLIISNYINAADEMRVYDTPPSADEVRKALFPESSPDTKESTNRSIYSTDGGEIKPFEQRGFGRANKSPTQPVTNTLKPEPSSTETSEQIISTKSRDKKIYSSENKNSVSANSSTIIAVQIQFGYKSSEIGSDQAAFLDPIGQGIAADTTKNSKLIIEGHTDGLGSASYNRRLSLQRAEAVKKYLVDNYQISPQRLITVGKGSSELLVKNDPADGRNRRIQFRRQ